MQTFSDIMLRFCIQFLNSLYDDLIDDVCMLR